MVSSSPHTTTSDPCLSNCELEKIYFHCNSGGELSRPRQIWPIFSEIVHLASTSDDCFLSNLCIHGHLRSRCRKTDAFFRFPKNFGYCENFRLTTTKVPPSSTNRAMSYGSGITFACHARPSPNPGQLEVSEVKLSGKQGDFGCAYSPCGGWTLGKGVTGSRGRSCMDDGPE
ncbi:hypothetical protein BC827DRAFT_1253957 [Russula dissimulans]|nr:hypothetical protein BC827DRAFT_1253957 [Russula dissimulans]